MTRGSSFPQASSFLYQKIMTTSYSLIKIIQGYKSIFCSRLAIDSRYLSRSLLATSFDVYRVVLLSIKNCILSIIPSSLENLLEPTPFRAQGILLRVVPFRSLPCLHASYQDPYQCYPPASKRLLPAHTEGAMRLVGPQLELFSSYHER